MPMRGTHFWRYPRFLQCLSGKIHDHPYLTIHLVCRFPGEWDLCFCFCLCLSQEVSSQRDWFIVVWSYVWRTGLQATHSRVQAGFLQFLSSFSLLRPLTMVSMTSRVSYGAGHPCRIEGQCWRCDVDFRVFTSDKIEHLHFFKNVMTGVKILTNLWSFRLRWYFDVRNCINKTFSIFDWVLVTASLSSFLRCHLRWCWLPDFHVEHPGSEFDFGRLDPQK